MRFPINIIASIIILLILTFIVYRLHGKKHFLLKYTVGINILFIIFLVVTTRILDTMDHLFIFLAGIEIFYGLIFIPFFGGVLFYLSRKMNRIEWYPKWSKHLILIVTFLIILSILIFGFAFFVFSFYGLAP